MGVLVYLSLWVLQTDRQTDRQTELLLEVLSDLKMQQVPEEIKNHWLGLELTFPIIDGFTGYPDYRYPRITGAGTTYWAYFWLLMTDWGQYPGPNFPSLFSCYRVGQMTPSAVSIKGNKMMITWTKEGNTFCENKNAISQGILLLSS